MRRGGQVSAGRCGAERRACLSVSLLCSPAPAAAARSMHRELGRRAGHPVPPARVLRADTASFASFPRCDAFSVSGAATLAGGALWGAALLDPYRRGQRVTESGHPLTPITRSNSHGLHMTGKGRESRDATPVRRVFIMRIIRLTLAAIMRVCF